MYGMWLAQCCMIAQSTQSVETTVEVLLLVHCVGVSFRLLLTSSQNKFKIYVAMIISLGSNWTTIQIIVAAM